MSSVSALDLDLIYQYKYAKDYQEETLDRHWRSPQAELWQLRPSALLFFGLNVKLKISFILWNIWAPDGMPITPPQWAVFNKNISQSFLYFSRMYRQNATQQLNILETVMKTGQREGPRIQDLMVMMTTMMKGGITREKGKKKPWQVFQRTEAIKVQHAVCASPFERMSHVRYSWRETRDSEPEDEHSPLTA